MRYQNKYFSISITIFFILILFNSCRTNTDIYSQVKNDINTNEYQLVKNNIDSILKFKFPNTPLGRFQLKESWTSTNFGVTREELTQDCKDNKPFILNRNQSIMMSYNYFINDSTKFSFIVFEVSRCMDISITDSTNFMLIDYLENKGIKKQYHNVINIINQRKIINIVDISLKYDSSSNSYPFWKVVHLGNQKSNKELPCLLISTDNNLIIKETAEPIIGK